MSAAPITVVTIGYGSEYAFVPLAAQLRARGVECIEIDMMVDGWRSRLEEARGKSRRVLLSSQHPTIGAHRFRRYYGIEADVLDLSGAIAAIRPERSYFVPHDLAMPIYGEEVAALREVDAALMPDDRFWWLRRFTGVHVVGWVRAIPSPDPPRLPDGDWVFLPSELGRWSKRPVEEFVACFEPLMRLQVPFKMPVFPGLDAIREALRSGGCPEIAPEVSATDVIRHYYGVVSMGLSSVFFEANSLARRALCVADGMVERASQISVLGSLAEIRFVAPAELEGALSSIGRGHMQSDLDCEFDIDLLIQIINLGCAYSDFQRL